MATAFENGILKFVQKAKRDQNIVIQGAAMGAIRHYLSHGDPTLANELVDKVAPVSKQIGARNSLIMYFERWARIRYDTKRQMLIRVKGSERPEWNGPLEAELAANPWYESSTPSAPPPSIVDADKELRKVVDRLLKVAQDPDRVLLHSTLLTKVQELIYTYGRTTEWANEDKKGRTLFDQSVKQSTLRASKYSKGA